MDNNLIPAGAINGSKDRANLVNFLVDGILPTPNLTSLTNDSKKSALSYSLNIAWQGVQIIDKTAGLDLRTETTKSINSLISEYKKAGGGNEYDKIFEQTKKEHKN